MPPSAPHFPEAVPIATPKVIEHMRQHVEEGVFERMWKAGFPGQIYWPQPGGLAEPLLDDGKRFLIEGRLQLRGYSLWTGAPDALRGEHQGQAGGMDRAVEMVEALEPAYVVPEHRQAEEIDGVWHLAATKKYLRDFGEVVAAGAKSPEVFEGMMRVYPERFNSAVLRLGSVGVFMVPEELRA